MFSENYGTVLDLLCQMSFTSYQNSRAKKKQITYFGNPENSRRFTYNILHIKMLIKQAHGLNIRGR